MILKHSDRELLRFEWIGPQGVHVVSVNESERKLLPLEMTGRRRLSARRTTLGGMTIPAFRPDAICLLNSPKSAYSTEDDIFMMRELSNVYMGFQMAIDNGN